VHHNHHPKGWPLLAKQTNDPPNISGVPQLDAYLATRLTSEEQAQMRQTYADGDREGSLAIVNKANTRNENKRG
jgi:hypothetical protein